MSGSSLIMMLIGRGEAKVKLEMRPASSLPCRNAGASARTGPCLQFTILRLSTYCRRSPHMQKTENSGLEDDTQSELYVAREISSSGISQCSLACSF